MLSWRPYMIILTASNKVGGFALYGNFENYKDLALLVRLPGLVKIFSARLHSRSLFRLTEPGSNPNVIDCLHGMRCMSLIWVIFGHQYLFALMAPNMNHFRLKWVKCFAFNLHFVSLYRLIEFRICSGSRDPLPASCYVHPSRWILSCFSVVCC